LRTREDRDENHPRQVRSAADEREERGADGGGQPGDTQGLSQTVDATEETVEELADAGQDYEAGIQAGIEDASDHPGRAVPSHDGQERRGGAAPRRGPA